MIMRVGIDHRSRRYVRSKYATVARLRTIRYRTLSHLGPNSRQKRSVLCGSLLGCSHWGSVCIRGARPYFAFIGHWPWIFFTLTVVEYERDGSDYWQGCHSLADRYADSRIRYGRIFGGATANEMGQCPHG